ncbi:MULTISPECIES: single-stranded DNA-binding protein [Bacillus cereus group]|uniref:single-stranded DNA-binding protein n=1 Tax=Bacillus cereus group TaxID=86661 RepID=UPI001EDEDB81|nr:MULTISPECIES: single-stranded DNA-binding protein [Bacillus cereus group]UKS61220.1 single-stranded DNA-binding protein [Bacillus toyonensis]
MDCLKLAIQEVENLNPGEMFLIKDLFKGYEWNRLAIGDRRSLGSLFLHEVKYGELNEKIEIGIKSSANQQQYKKK